MPDGCTRMTDGACCACFRATRPRSAPSSSPIRSPMASAPSCRRRACWSSPRRCRRPGRSASSTRTWRRPRDEDFAWAEVVFVSGMHVQRRQIEDIRRRAQALDRSRVLGGSSVSACPEHYPEFDYLHVGELGDATDELFARLAGRCHAPAAPGRAHHTRAARADRISDAGLRAGADRPLSARQHPVLQRLSVSVRILRHPRALRPRRAIQDGRAGLRRARQARGLRTVHLGLFRRRQFHRQQARRARDAAAPDRVAEAQRLSVAAVVRGDAQHRQAAGNPRADARGGVHDRSSAASRRPIPRR